MSTHKMKNHLKNEQLTMSNEQCDQRGALIARFSLSIVNGTFYMSHFSLFKRLSKFPNYWNYVIVDENHIWQKTWHNTVEEN